MRRHPRRDRQGCLGKSVEIAGLALHALAFLAFRDIAYFSVFEDGFHLNFAAAGAVEVVGAAGRTGVLGNLCHCILLGKTR